MFERERERENFQVREIKREKRSERGNIVSRVGKSCAKVNN
jgi:hypothetical protein